MTKQVMSHALHQCKSGQNLQAPVLSRKLQQRCSALCCQKLLLSSLAGLSLVRGCGFNMTRSQGGAFAGNALPDASID